MQQSLLDSTAMTPGAALQHVYQRKLSQAEEDCKKEGITFIPIPVECTGGWHSKSVEVISKLGKQLARQTGREETQAVEHLFQRLSVSLAKANASLLTSRQPSHAPQIVDGDIDN